jgi:hypothetical protein
MRTAPNIQDPDSTTKARTSTSPHVSTKNTDRNHPAPEIKNNNLAHPGIPIVRRVAPTACRPAGATAVALPGTAKSIFEGVSRC